MEFAKLLGNEQAKTSLMQLAMQPRDSHILLLSGADGVGKKTFAIAFLSVLLGEKHVNKIEAKIHPDVIWLKPDGKLHLHAASSIKQMMDEAPLSPFEAKKKVYVIEEADRMLAYSSNALLKMLEEPPAHVSFLLLTSQEEKILPTILSRCSRIPFYPIEEALMVSFLEGKGASYEKACLFAKKSKGSLTLALKFFSEEKDLVKTHFIEMLRHFFLQKPSLSFIQALDHLDKLIEEQAEEEEATSKIAEKLLDEVFFWVRDLHFLKEDPDTKDLFYENYIEDLTRQARKNIPSLEEVLVILDKARLALQRSIKPKVVFEKLFANLLGSTW